MRHSAKGSKIKVGVFGGSGYVGLETIRLLLQHPDVLLATVTSREHAGKPVAEVHRSLAGLLETNFSAPSQEFDDLDVLFLSVPHAQSAPVVQRLAASKRYAQGALRLIDLGADFRLPAERFSQFYKEVHPCPELINEAVYGSPEINRERIKAATLVANPGCFANCITLGLLPLTSALATQGAAPLVAHVSAITGSSGSGITATQKTHHPERNESFSAYEVLTHRHIPEIEQALRTAAATPKSVAQVMLVPHSGSFSRGIYATIFVTIPDPALPVVSLYQEFAEREFFIRLRSGTPRLLDVRGSNFCDIAVHQHGNQVVIISTIDNLVKGAAGNAIQNMNIMCGLDESTGLTAAALTP